MVLHMEKLLKCNHLYSVISRSESNIVKNCNYSQEGF